MTHREIIFYAPFGKGIPIESIGGGEAGCLKTKAIYEKDGIVVHRLDKPAISAGKLQYFLGLMVIPFKLVVLMLKYPHAPVHITGFYWKIAGYEWMLLKLCMLFGHKTIYELRNGTMVQSYKEGNARYRKTLKKLLLKPDVVLCQGQEYVDFIKEMWGVERSYYPNYIMDEYVGSNNTDRPHPIKLIFFGRLVAPKRIDIIIDTLVLLRHAGYDATLDLIGGYNDDYKDELDKQIANAGVAPYVTFHGRQRFDFIAQKLKSSHYFVFPSENRQEGHSNSLTEAMGCGVVPIVSPAGFNTSICGDAELVIEQMEAVRYAEKIIQIERAGKWEHYSNQVFQRVKTMYTSQVVGEKLLSYINPLLPHPAKA